MTVQRTREGGFTILEVAFAAVTLAIAAVGLAAALAQGDHLTDGAQNEMRARNAIRSVLSEITSASFTDCAQLYMDKGFVVDGLQPASDDPDGMPGEIRFAYGPGGDKSFYTVTVRVRWADANGSRTVESVRFVGNVRGDTGQPTPLEKIRSTNP